MRCVSGGEEAEKDRPTSICIEEAEEDIPTSACVEDAGEVGATSTCVEENGVTGLCLEKGGVTSHVVELSHADKDLCTEGSSPALEGGTPQSGASAEDQRPAAYRRRRRGRQWQRAQVAHTAWLNEDAWRQCSEPRYPQGSQRRRAAAHAWRPKD